jgi:hypothetical protein
MTSPANDQVRWGEAISILVGMEALAFSVSPFTSTIPSIMAGSRADVDRIQWVVTCSGMTQMVVMQGSGAGLMPPTLTAILYSLFPRSVVALLPMSFLPGYECVTKKKN